MDCRRLVRYVNPPHTVRQVIQKRPFSVQTIMPSARSLEFDNWYDHPQYFDMVFRDETAAEIDFFHAAFDRFADGPVKRVFEPGCGSGRLVTAMAAGGFDVTGIDLSAPSLAYLRKKLKRRGLDATLMRDDFTRLQLPGTFDAAFCTFNTFRHLTDEASAVSHLRSVADHLRPGGLYILGLHIIPLDAEKQCTERWKASHGVTTVNVTLRVTDFNRRKRIEQIHVVLTAKSPGKTVRCRTDFPLRLYTMTQFQKTLAQVPGLEIAGAYDFDYDLDSPRQIDDDLIDSVFVLKKTAP
jgi:SAM-dependent methyltransferase